MSPSFTWWRARLSGAALLAALVVALTST
jgi:hypothetical protein